MLHGCPHRLEQTPRVLHVVALHGVEDDLTETLQRDGFVHDGVKHLLNRHRVLRACSLSSFKCCEVRVILDAR